MKNILVVFTGGTIGSIEDTASIHPSKEHAFKLLSHYRQQHSQEAVTFTSIDPLNILSENIKPADWTRLIKAIEKADVTLYDGIIVTHGTDTLAISAALLSFYFHAISIPMLLVSSHLPLDNPLTNGHDNFYAAVKFIQASQAPGVFVSYRNPHESFVSIFYGTKIEMSTQLSSCFHSIQTLFTRFENGTFSQHKELETPLSTFDLEANFCSDLLYIKPYPGINYAHYNLDKVKVVLHDLYHSGTADFEPLLDFIKRCQNKNIPVFLSPIVKNETYYESSVNLQETSAIFIYNMSIEASLAKLYLAYGNFNHIDKIKKFMQTPLHYEFLE